jgi:carboxymethylenebutenolidase
MDRVYSLCPLRRSSGLRHIPLTFSATTSRRLNASEEATLERKKASDFPQELLDLFDHYVHGRMSRRAFLRRAQAFAAAGASAASLFQMLKPNYAWAIQVQPDDKRIRTETVVVPSPKGNGTISGYLARPANDDRLPGVLVIHENRGLNPYIEDVARRLAVANFIAFAPDGLTPVGGYPGDDDKGAALFKKVDQGKMRQDFLAAAEWLKSRPDSTGKLGAIGFCFGGGIVNALAVEMGGDLAAAVPFYGAQPSAADAARIKAPINAQYGELDSYMTPGWPAFDAALTAAGLDSGAKRNALKRSGFERPFQARQSRLGMAS